MSIDLTKLDEFRRQHTILSYHVAALGMAVYAYEEACKQKEAGRITNTEGQRGNVEYHKSRIRGLVNDM